MFAFSASTASMEVLQLLSMLIAPSDIADIGAQNYHFTTGELDIAQPACRDTCPYSTILLASGGHSGIQVSGDHRAAYDERQARAKIRSRPVARLGRWVDDRLGR